MGGGRKGKKKLFTRILPLWTTEDEVVVVVGGGGGHLT